VTPILPQHLESGQHLVVISDGDEIAKEARAQGWQLRDTLLAMQSTKVLFVYLFRKPLEAPLLETLRRVGRGALYIDAARVTWRSDAERQAALPGSMPKANLSIGAWSQTKPRTFDTRDRTQERPEDSQSPLGRWPCNLVLMHDMECSETCTSTCMVPRLDRQSGQLKSGSGSVIAESAKGYKPLAYGTESRPVGTQMISYPDIGGASRYYPKVKGMPGLVSWLEQLLRTPGTSETKLPPELQPSDEQPPVT
jgi:hypothetical protein